MPLHRSKPVLLMVLLALAFPLAATADSTAQRAKRPALSATPATPLQGTAVKLRTRLPTKFRRPAALQQNSGAGWVTVLKKRTKRTGKVAFTLVAPGDVTFRVKAKAVRHKGKRYRAVRSKVRRVAATPRAELVSVSLAGASSGEQSGIVSMSGDGRYVVFHSSAQNLVPGFTGYVDESSNVYLRDRLAGTTVLVSAAGAGVVGNSDSARPAISRDGRYVTYASYASNLVVGDTNGHQDIFRWDRQTASTIKITEAGAGGDTDDDSFDPTISADGQRIAYSTEATNIDADDDNGISDMYVWSADTDESDRISETLADGDANGASNAGVIAANGTHVTFSSHASDLVLNDGNGARDVFRHNIETDTTALVSRATSGDTNDYSSGSAISADGRFVAFASAAENLVAGGTPDNGLTNTFVRDMIAGTTVLVSRERNGGATDNYSFAPATVSDDGRLVIFPSRASDLVAGDTNGQSDAFLWDRATGTLTMPLRDVLWGPLNGATFEPALSADGRWIGFYSTATDAVRNDTNPISDVLVWRR